MSLLKETNYIDSEYILYFEQWYDKKWLVPVGELLRGEAEKTSPQGAVAGRKKMLRKRRPHASGPDRSPSLKRSADQRGHTAGSIQGQSAKGKGRVRHMHRVQWSPDNSHKNNEKNLCKLSRIWKLSIHRSQWGSKQLCEWQLCQLSGMCE